MKRNNRIILAVACLALAALACNAMTGGGGDTSPTSDPGPQVLLSDDFSSQTWGTGTDADSSVEYANGALQVVVYTKNYFVWSTPNDQDYQNAHIEVTVINHGTDSTTAFGIMCSKQSGSSNFYYLAMTPAGEYAIAKAAEGQSDVFLTNDDQWGVSEQIAQNASSYRVGADCGNGSLTLYVDGQQIASVADASYTSGGVALFTWSGEEATTTNVSFDDFLMTELQ
jgi:predicted small secreted protein